LWADECSRYTQNWLKLSNSGDTLKLLVPNYSREAICGWNRHPGMVISQKIIERAVGYRGSKSEFIFNLNNLNRNSVKEQRVDGSWLLNLAVPKKFSSLRCILMGSERNHQVKNLTKQLTSRTYSTLSSKPLLNPWFITGFSDAEASFIVSALPPCHRT